VPHPKSLQARLWQARQIDKYLVAERPKPSLKERAMEQESRSTADQETVEGASRLKIFFRSWRPVEKPQATVVIIPGFNAHSGYYEWVAAQFVAAGLAVYAVDLRGRGKSDGERFYVEAFEDYVRDVEAVMAVVKSREPEPPIFLLGHSAGGVVACLYTLDHQAELKGLICESFAHELPAPDFALAVFKGLSHVAPHAHILHLPNERFSRDPKAVETMNNDPLIAHETQPTQTMAALVRADERLKKEFSQIALPVLILHGTLDKNTKPSGSQHFYDMAGSTDKTLKLYEGGFHDLLNDVEKESVILDIKSWINGHLPSATGNQSQTVRA
jgi:acylglycerol lipase